MEKIVYRDYLVMRLSQTGDFKHLRRMSEHLYEKEEEEEKTERKSFQTALDHFAELANGDRTSPEYVEALTELGTAIAYAVLKKCIDTSANPTLSMIRSDLSRDRRNLANLQTAGLTAYRMRANRDGDPVRTVNNKDAVKALNSLSSESMGDGLDLVNDAIVAILSEVERMDENGDRVDLTAPYTVRRLNRKIWIKMEDSVNGWEDVETSPIIEIYKSVRRAIMASRAGQTDPRNGYSYIEDIATDPETGETADVFRRLPKYADLGGKVTDFNGSFVAYTVEKETVDRYDAIVDALRLSKKQSTVLTLRMSGYGYESIATYLGVTKNSVICTIRQIREKATAIGLNPDHLGENVKSRSHHKK